MLPDDVVHPACAVSRLCRQQQRARQHHFLTRNGLQDGGTYSLMDKWFVFHKVKLITNSDYGYDISKNGDLIKGKEKFRVLANIPTKKVQENQLLLFMVFQMLKFLKKWEHNLFFTMGHDGRVYGIISNQSKYAPFSVPNLYGTLNKFLKRQQKFSTYIKNNKWSIEK